MISLLLPLAFTHQIAHYTDLILGTMISAIISDLIITIRSPHFGKLFFDNHFIKFWKLFLYSVLLLGLFAILFDLISPHIDTLMDSNLNYYFGISSCVLAFFFMWFVYAFDFNIKTQKKWVFPLVCFIITILNIVILTVKF